MDLRLPGKGWLLAALLLLQTSPALSTFWTVTSFYQLSMSTSHYGTYTDDVFYYTYTDTQTVKPGVTPTSGSVSASTYTNTYEDVTIIYIYLAPGAVPQSDLVVTTSDYTYDNQVTYYVEEVVYTAPASCPTPFTVTTATVINVPEGAEDQVTPVSTATSVDTYGDPYTYITKYLSPSAVPLSRTPGTTDYVYTYFLADCRNPTATGDAYWGPSGGGSRSGGDDDDDDGYDPYKSLKGWVIAVIVIASLLPVFFLFGFLENWLWFRRLMLGQNTLRFGTISWTMISLWVLCMTRKQPARTPEDQAKLKAQWEAMSGGTKWKLWWKWGFRHAYPVDLLGDPNVPGSAPDVPQIQQIPVQDQPLSDPKSAMATAQPFQGAVPPQQYQWTGQPGYYYVQPGQPVQGQFPTQFQMQQPPQYHGQMPQPFPEQAMQSQGQTLSPQATGTTMTQVPSPQTPSPTPIGQGPYPYSNNPPPPQNPHPQQ